MPTPRRPRAQLSPWLIFGPLLILAGAGLGRFYPAIVGLDVGRDGRRDVGGDLAKRLPSSPQNPDSERRSFGPSSLAPLLDEVRSGVVVVTTMRNQDGTGRDPSSLETANSDGVIAPRIRPPAALAEFGIVRGTGFVVHADGLVVTSLHVVADYARIRVDLANHRSYSATVVGADTISDLALLRIEDAPADLQPLELGDSDSVRQGDFVMSLGNPYEFHRSLSFGLITFVGRHLTEEGVHVTNEYLQFSAPVNPGQSGAPLFDMFGRVVGVTRRTLTEGRGISFAVPAKAVETLLRSVEGGAAHVRRGYIGMEFCVPTHPELLRGLLVEGGGAEVTRVLKGHPADIAGVRVGDVILSYGGEPVERAADLYERITESEPGTAKPLSIFRDGTVLPPMTVRVSEVGKTSVD